MSEEKGISTEKLKNMESDKILIKTRKIKVVHDAMERMLATLKEIGSSIQRVDTLKNQYVVQKDFMHSQMEKVVSNEIFDDRKLEEMSNEARFYTKDKLIQSYKQLEIKYLDLTEYYTRIDNEYYKDLLSEISEAL